MTPPVGDLLRSWPVGLLLAAADVAIVAYVFYRLILFIRGTRAVHLIRGLVVLLAVTAISRRLHLDTAYWLLEKVQLALAVAVPIVFQPELRRALEQVGRGRFFPASLTSMEADAVSQVVDEVVRAAFILARKKQGAIIVLERETGLGDVAETGIRIDGLASAEFLVNVFAPNTPLHDGAVILRGNRVLAAACLLPLAEVHELGTEFGTRHRAAVGITEHSDAVALVVSEETGAVSLANGGKLIRNLDEQTLRETLQALLLPKEQGLGFRGGRDPAKARGRHG